MRPFACITVLIVLAVAALAEEQPAAKEAGEAKEAAAAAGSSEAATFKTYKRLIPADVLRDFPGMCFASTRCATVEVTKTWDLTPFCGRSTCVASDDGSGRLLELVEDCGPLPLANDKCKLDTERTVKSAPFPGCCPRFSCEDGVQLEYPEVGAAAPGGPSAAAAEAAPAAAAAEKQ